MACQPSARMKTRTLAGREMTVGGSIIIPMLIKQRRHDEINDDKRDVDDEARR